MSGIWVAIKVVAIPAAIAFFMSYLLSDNQLSIYEFNRFIKDLNGLTPDEFLIELDMYLNAESDAEAKVLAKKFERLIDKELDNRIKVQRIIEPSINQTRIIR